MSAAPVIASDYPANVRAAINAALAACFDAAVHQANAYTAGGTATAFTLTPTPALTANAANVRYAVNFGMAAGTSPTLAVSGQAALPLVQYSASGALVAATWLGTLVTDVVCDGTHWIVLDPPLPAAISAVTGAFSGAVSALQFNGGAAGLTGAAPNLTAGAANTAAACTGNAATATLASAVAWPNVTGHPTALSSFTNDSGYTTIANVLSAAPATLTPTSSTTYTNSTGKPMLIFGLASTVSGQTIAFYVNGTIVYTLTYNSSSYGTPFCLPVPAGGTYEIVKGASCIVTMFNVN